MHECWHRLRSKRPFETTHGYSPCFHDHHRSSQRASQFTTILGWKSLAVTTKKATTYGKWWTWWWKGQELDDGKSGSGKWKIKSGIEAEAGNTRQYQSIVPEWWFPPLQDCFLVKNLPQGRHRVVPFTLGRWHVCSVTSIYRRQSLQTFCKSARIVPSAK